MSIAAPISSFGQPQHRYGKQALSLGAFTAFAVHALAAIAIFSIVATPPAVPSAPIMVTMITAPTPEPIRPEPQVLPKPRPVIKQTLPTPKTLLVAEKPAAEPAQAAPTPPPAAAPAAPPAPSPVAIPPRLDAAYLDNPKPIYPPMARRMGIEGKVILNVLVTADGAAGQVELHKSSGDSRLDQSALDAVKRWRFVPAKRGSQPISDWFLIPISFTLGA